MVILHMSHEAYGPAMLEACLIHQHQGTLPSITYALKLLLYIHICTLSMKCRALKLQLNQGKPGCKNTRLGGDTIQEGSTLEASFVTYLVYRSLKHPPSGDERTFKRKRPD